MIRIAVVIGSTRPGRVGGDVGRWVYDLAKGRSDAEFENFSEFRPHPRNEDSVTAMLDQLVAWGGALKVLREKRS